MVYCLDRSSCAGQITQLLKGYATSSSSSSSASHSLSTSTRIAHLYLLSDLLYNSGQFGVKNASLFRGEVLSVAGEVLRAMRRLERVIVIVKVKVKVFII